MEQIVKELHEAAAEGNVPSLLKLVEKDHFVLDRSMVISYGETPLHIACMLGHLEFCKELLRRKPELAEELDSRRSSALHVASAKGFTEIVRLLVSVSPKMGFTFDEGGKIPLHVAAMKGRVDVLKELVDVQPETAHEVVKMSQGETVLHLCVQYSQLEALRFLVEHLNDDEELLNAKDDHGNSILHLAAFDKQVEIIHYLVENTKIDVHEVNSIGLTTLDILVQSRRDSKYIQVYLSLHNHASQSSQGEHETKGENPSIRDKKLSKSKERTRLLYEDKRTLLEKFRETYMIVASLIATMGFQATLTPPGGFWQEDTTHKNSTALQYIAGNSIYADKYPDKYSSFMISNTIGFIASLTSIFFLILGLPFNITAFTTIAAINIGASISCIAHVYSMSVEASVLAPPSNQTLASFLKLPSGIHIWTAFMGVFAIISIGLICRIPVIMKLKSFFSRSEEVIESSRNQNRIVVV